MSSEAAASLGAFLLYTAAVLALAWLAHRVGSRKSFLSEYFLGSRSLGMVALALTFGATSASAGSFAGFPSLIYAHGWVLALWIASYMVFPLCGMGLLGKRLNHVARRTGAITVPDVLRARFESRALPLISTVLLALLLTVYLIPQFTLASLIVQQLLGNVNAFQRMALGLAHTMPWIVPTGSSAEYVLGLVLFSVLVVGYTAFGGFRAVVWTDILQGFVMVAGVLVMLVLALWQAGGLRNATAMMTDMEPPRLGEVTFVRADSMQREGIRVAVDSWFTVGDRLFRTNETAFIVPGTRTSAPVKMVEIVTPQEKARVKQHGFTPLPAAIIPELQSVRSYARGADEPGVYVSAPGPSPTDPDGFLPFGLAVSFFAFWALSGTGQPGNMVRLMAFSNTATLRRAIASLSIYFTLIYVPLVIIFCCARVLSPGLDHTPDRIMPVMAFLLADGAHVPWLAGLLIAAPFAAAMSTVDSFMLMITSSVVRDIYQQNVRPSARERTLKRMSYACIITVGVLATAGALYPPQFLQYIIVFTGGGLAVAFLGPVALALYWPRFNTIGALASIIGGFAAYLALYVLGFATLGAITPVRPLGLDPLIWGFVASLGCATIGTLASPPPPDRLVRQFFHVPTARTAAPGPESAEGL